MQPHDLPGHRLEPVKSPLHPSASRRAKRTHAANQKKRVQRGGSAASTFDSLAQVWGAQPQRTPRGKHYKANVIAQKRTSAAPPAPFPVGIAIKKRPNPK